MIWIIVFTALSIAALAYAIGSNVLPSAAKKLLAIIAVVLFILGLLVGSSVVIGNQETGIVLKLWGPKLPPGDVIARNGEAGPQAEILPPGYYFGFWPLVYDVKLDSVKTIDQNHVGIVSARDGRPLPENEVFAPEWKSAKDMLDAVKFLQPDGGYRGPQSTVLTPGTYRYNTALFQVTPIPATTVPAGKVAVIKSNTGGTPDAAAQVDSVNGVPLVRKGFRGVWSEPLMPGLYYLNTAAYEPIFVKTTQRVYTYQASISSPRQKAGSRPDDPQDWSVSVRTKDGFTFPIDIRVVCAVEAKDAPHLVALLGNPDQIVKDDQEDEQLEILEAKVILPAIRAVFRNEAEGKGALEFVDKRSEIEAAALKAVRTELAKSRVTTMGIYLGQIHLDVTEAGRQLIKTQTDKEVAKHQQVLYGQQKLAEDSRAVLVKAQENADQQKNLAAAEYGVLINKANADANIARARGEAQALEIVGQGRANAYRVMVETLGADQVAQLELMKLAVEGKIRITPDVMVTGSNGTNSGSIDALAATLLRRENSTPASGAPAARPNPALAPAPANK